MSNENDQSVLSELKTALAEVPQEFHKDVSKALVHDIGVMARTISIVEKRSEQSAAEGL